MYMGKIKLISQIKHTHFGRKVVEGRKISKMDRPGKLGFSSERSSSLTHFFIRQSQLTVGYYFTERKLRT